jgi:hypothetical protein
MAEKAALNSLVKRSQANHKKNIGDQVSLRTQYLKEHPDGNEQGFIEWQELNNNKFDGIAAGAQKMMQVRDKMVAELMGITPEKCGNYLLNLIGKTLPGIAIQERIGKEIAKSLGLRRRKSKPEEDSRGIDLWIGQESYSIKPSSYQLSGGGKIIEAQNHVYYWFNATGILQYKSYNHEALNNVEQAFAAIDYDLVA